MQGPARNTFVNSSIAALYQYYAPSILAYVRHHSSGDQDAEDLLVEVFLAALEDKKFSTFTEKEQVAWLRRVARNKVIDAYRHSVRYPQVALEPMAEMLYDAEEHSPEQVTLRHEEYRQLRVALERLSPLQQEVLHLRFTCSLRCAEIATIVGKQEGAVRVLLSRTLNVLRNTYEKP